MVHNANNLRPKRDGLKVGGHQASSASLATILTVLYTSVLQPQDRVAIKPHASPIFHALMYMMGRQTLENIRNFRGFGGAQAYPSRTKDLPEVDFSTGSVGMGAAATIFASLTETYLRAHGLPPKPWPGTSEAPSRPGRMISIVGDAELDEGVCMEALLESWKLKVENSWCIVDYNRQSLDMNLHERMVRVHERLFRLAEWEVVTLKYGKRLMKAFDQPGGKQLHQWLNNVTNAEFSALIFRSGSAWREAMLRDSPSPAFAELVGRHTDEALHALMTDLGGHCAETLLEAFEFAAQTEKRTVFIAYTIKGHGLPLAGHRDNHGLFLAPQQFNKLRTKLGLTEANEWAPFSGLADPSAVRALCEAAPIHRNVPTRNHGLAERIAIPIDLGGLAAAPTSTQAAFGAVLKAIAHTDCTFADRLVSACPDVTTTTGLSAFVNKRGVFGSEESKDPFKSAKAHSLSNWSRRPSGQHIELGIAENNLAQLLSALGLSAPLFGHRLFPIGTLYDPFISRALDTLTFGAYQDSRFMLVGTPSGVTLSPEGGAHQSFNTPVMMMAMPNLRGYEPAFADEVQVVMRDGFERMQLPADEGGGSVYLRLSTRVLTQPDRELLRDCELHAHVLAGGYWHVPPDARTTTALVFAGALAPEAIEAQRLRGPATALLQITSYDALASEWQRAGTRSHVHTLLSGLPRKARLVTVLDGNATALSWLGSVHGHRTIALGVQAFGQSGDLVDVYCAHRIDTQAMLEACEEA
ncbi:transketolase domain-containing protein [Pavlovales sp. CCMP2436]|nr:transketolase domain-containing protein [Pavlovales sp. CCMP2436]